MAMTPISSSTPLGSPASAAQAAGGADFVNQLLKPKEASASSGEMGDRFLKLLVAQMQNQDPLNPLDNAQVTTQMAQINTVSGIEKLNKTMTDLSTSLGDKLGALVTPSLDKLNGTLTSLSGQMLQSQALQGAGLVGRTVLLEGNRLDVRTTPNADGSSSTRAGGSFDLAGPADQVDVDVLGPAGQLLDTVKLGAQSSGRQSFSWTPPAGADTQGLTFRVKASSGTTPVAATPLMSDSVKSVSTGADGLTLTLELLRSGATPFNLVKAVS